MILCTYIRSYAVCHFTLNADVTVNTIYSGITILQGDNITLSCTPSQSDISLQWSYNGSNISSSSHYQFSSYYHNLTIIQANVTDSGNYICAFRLNNRATDQSINLTVVPSKYPYSCSYNFINCLFLLSTSLFAKLFWWFTVAYK